MTDVTVPSAPDDHDNDLASPAGNSLSWDWRPKIRWFAAEILVVVVGVLVALALNAWWQGKQEAAQERIVLDELQTALQNDLVILSTQLATFRETVKKIDALSEHLEAARPYSDSLDAYFGSVYVLGIVAVNTSPYESLKSRGLGLISNAALRSDVTRLYDLRYRILVEIQETQRSAVLGIMRPYFLTHFEDLVFGVTATPFSYDQIAGDRYFHNLMAYRRQIIVSSEIPVYEQTIAQISKLQSSIEKELSR
ncbi:MAG: hypothetical protein HKN43_04410 [Rhodothermales bacterium]|nr:hypothetical protein [Rhodothermales bacterium]